MWFSFYRSAAAFMDTNQDKLIQRASCMEPILDQLLQLKVINDEEYSDLRAENTPQRKMRALLTGPIRAAGDLGKVKLYNILMFQQKHMMEDLRSASLR